MFTNLKTFSKLLIEVKKSYKKKGKRFTEGDIGLSVGYHPTNFSKIKKGTYEVPEDKQDIFIDFFRENIDGCNITKEGLFSETELYEKENTDSENRREQKNKIKISEDRKVDKPQIMDKYKLIEFDEYLKIIKNGRTAVYNLFPSNDFFALTRTPTTRVNKPSEYNVSITKIQKTTDYYPVTSFFDFAVNFFEEVSNEPDLSIHHPNFQDEYRGRLYNYNPDKKRLDLKIKIIERMIEHYSDDERSLHFFNPDNIEFGKFELVEDSSIVIYTTTLHNQFIVIESESLYKNYLNLLGIEQKLDTDLSLAMLHQLLRITEIEKMQNAPWNPHHLFKEEFKKHEGYVSNNLSYDRFEELITFVEGAMSFHLL